MFQFSRSSQYIKFVLLFSSLFAGICAKQIALHDQLTEIGNLHMNSLNLIQPKIVQNNPEERSFLSKLFPKYKPLEISEFEKYSTVFNLVSTYTKENNMNVAPIVDSTFIKKMELFCGGEDVQNTLLSKWNNTHTIFGTAMLANKLSQPTADTKTMVCNQNVVKELVGNKIALKHLDAAFKKMESTEDQLLLLWQNQNVESNTQLMQTLYFPSVPGMNKLNKRPEILSAYKGTIHIFQLLSIGSIAYAIYRMRQIPFGINQTNGFRAYLGAIEILLGTTNYNTISQQNAILRQIQGQLIDVAEYIQQLKKIDKIVQSNKTLKVNIPLANTLHTTIHALEEKKLKNIFDLLNTSTFKGKPSFFSYHGRILAAHHILKDIKDALVPALIAAGEIEAYVSMAQLYTTFQNSNTPYTFVEFVENSDTPYIEAIDFWNPFVNPQDVVPNSIKMGNKTAYNTIITGPNTGGKSTVLKALLIDMLLAQTFGLAPAKQFIMTPFARINCYLNITDNISAGTSLFKAEVLRAKELITSIKELPDNAFSFTIMDEVFSGTSPKEGEHAAYLFAKQLGEQSKSATIIATHFAKLTELPDATDGAYNNKHVEVIKHDDGIIERTFLLKDGPSFLNIATDILIEEGVLQADQL